MIHPEWILNPESFCHLLGFIKLTFFPCFSAKLSIQLLRSNVQWRCVLYNHDFTIKFEIGKKRSLNFLAAVSHIVEYGPIPPWPGSSLACSSHGGCWMALKTFKYFVMLIRKYFSHWRGYSFTINDPSYAFSPLLPRPSLTAALCSEGGLPDGFRLHLCHSQYCRLDPAFSKIWQVLSCVSLALVSAVCLAGRHQTHSYRFSYSRRRGNCLAIWSSSYFKIYQFNVLNIEPSRSHNGPAASGRSCGGSAGGRTGWCGWRPGRSPQPTAWLSTAAGSDRIQAGGMIMVFASDISHKTKLHA